jgi:uncharacterized coiled-coil protein SlyX
MWWVWFAFAGGLPMAARALPPTLVNLQQSLDARIKSLQQQVADRGDQVQELKDALNACQEQVKQHVMGSLKLTHMLQPSGASVPQFLPVCIIP